VRFIVVLAAACLLSPAAAPAVAGTAPSLHAQSTDFSAAKKAKKQAKAKVEYMRAVPSK
jgi:hypothetical protein